MIKRLSLLLAALFVGAALFAAPVFASGNGDTNNNGNNDKVCVLRHHDDDNGKDYRWVWDVDDLRVGDKVVKDKYCKDDDHNGNANGNGDHNGNGNGDDHNGNDR
jgi:hypothetical protein